MEGTHEGTAPGLLATVEGFPAAGGAIDLQVCRGEIVLLEGPNGAGKSSLLRSLAGLTGGIVPKDVRLGPRQMVPRSIPGQDLRRGVRAAWQSPRDTLVGLTIAGEFRLRGHPVPPMANAAGGTSIRATPAVPWRERTVATLSSGEARRLSLQVVEASGAPLLLLDEPAEGLDAAARSDLVRLVRTAAKAGAVVAADHTGLLAPLATRTVLLGATGQATRSSPDAPGRSQGPGQPSPADRDPQGPARLVSPNQTLKRGKTRVAVPALSLPAGFHVLAGPNGGGKSTLLLGLAGLLDASASIDDGLPMPGVNVRLLLPNVRDLFCSGTVAEELGNAAGSVGRATAVASTAFVAPDLLERHPLTLSAGEAQRLALAKTFGHRAPVYLLDEPEANLDAAGREALLAAIAASVREGSCVLAATHDPGLIGLADSVVRVGA